MKITFQIENFEELGKLRDFLNKMPLGDKPAAIVPEEPSKDGLEVFGLSDGALFHLRKAGYNRYTFAEVDLRTIPLYYRAEVKMAIIKCKASKEGKA